MQNKVERGTVLPHLIFAAAMKIWRGGTINPCRREADSHLCIFYGNSARERLLYGASKNKNEHADFGLRKNSRPISHTLNVL